MHKAKNIWVGIKEGPKGDEIIAVQVPDGNFLPLVSSERKLAEGFAVVLEQIAKEQGVRTELRKFSTYETVKVFGEKQ